MPIQRPFLLYLRSRFHLALALPTAALVVLCLAFLRPHALLSTLLVIGVYLLLTIGLFFTRRGAREVVNESEEDRRKRIRLKIQELEGVRQRIAVLRLGSEAMSRAVELFLQETGTYLERCRALDLYSPLANERIERVLEICQVFLGERDEAATGKRYGLPGTPDAAPEPELARDIVECAQVIRQRTTEDLVGTSGAERLRIMKELEGRQ